MCRARCAAYDELLETALLTYTGSHPYEALLGKMGAYAEGVAGRVGADALATLASQFDKVRSPLAETVTLPLHYRYITATRCIARWQRQASCTCRWS